MKRIWQWLKAQFAALFGSRPTIEVFSAHDVVRDKIRSANICLASNGATKRERSNARDTLRRR